MSNGIDFVIGGKDEASPAMEEVEKSMDKLLDQQIEFHRISQRTTAATNHIAGGLTKLDNSSEKLKTSTMSLNAVLGKAAIAYGAIKSAMALLAGLDKINAAYDESAGAVKGLETALRLQGANVEAESARLQTFASGMQQLVGAEDDATLAMMKQASMMGVATDDLDDMAKAAIGLGEIMGSDAAAGMDMMRRAQEGNFIGLQKMFPAMRQMTTDEEKLAFVLAKAKDGLEAKADASNRVAGMGERANNALGDLMESVGALLAPVRMLISAGLTTLYESLSTLLIPAVEYANEVLENIGPIMDYVKAKVIDGVNAIVAAFTFFEVILTNLDSVWEIVVAQSELWMLQLVGVIEHALTVAIPAYAAWFGENFVNLIRDGLMLAFTVVTNHVQKIIDAFKALGDFIASGGTSDVLGKLGEISGRSWLEGFESSLTDLPSVMGRTISDREKELGETIGRVGGELGDEFSRKFAERMIKAGGGITDGLDTDINLKMNGPENKAKRNDGTFGASINATESRLLTRGPSSTVAELMQQILQQVKKLVEKPVMDGDSKANIDAIKKAAQDAAKNTIIAVAIP